MNRPLEGDRGSSSKEMLLIGTPLLLLMGWVMTWGLAGLADSGVSGAARAAARAAALAEGPHQADAAGKQAASDALARHHNECTDATVHIDTTGFATPVGQPATVTATVACTVPLDQISVPGMPGSRTLSETFTVSLDQYTRRSR